MRDRPTPSPGLLVLCAAAATVCLATAPVLAADNTIDISITTTGCVPASVLVPPGKTIFKIRNESQRKVEWEILKGVMVVEERENIVPGFVQSLTATLDPGDYLMTCGLLSNPKGTLKVGAGEVDRKAAAAAVNLILDEGRTRDID